MKKIIVIYFIILKSNCIFNWNPFKNEDTELRRVLNEEYFPHIQKQLNQIYQNQNSNMFFFEKLEKPLAILWVGGSLLLSFHMVLSSFSPTYKKYFNQLISFISPKPKQPSLQKKIRLKDIGGYKKIKEKLLKIMQNAKTTDQDNVTGIILYGPPGSGKTFIAQAIANEINIPIKVIKITDILTMFVGNSENQLKEILETAKDNAPYIILIDEIENLLEDRNAPSMPGHPGPNLKNLFLTYMDGTEIMKNVIIIGTTNRLNIIDPAFLRSGRFEHKINIDLPEYNDRLDIINLYIKKNNIILNNNLTAAYIAEKTNGFSPADIKKLFQNIKNIFNSNHITLENFIQTYLDTILGEENKEIILNKNEKKNTAIHESGHALVSFILSRINNNYSTFDFVTITPRGRTLGTSHSKKDAEYRSLTKEHSENQIAIALAGRIAQEIILHKIDSGASNDLKNATLIAETMITNFGFGKKLSQKQDSTMITNEINEIIEAQYKKVTLFLQKYKALLLEISNELIKKETLYKIDLEKIVKEYEKKNKCIVIYQ